MASQKREGRYIVSERRGWGKREGRRRPPESYLEASFVWRVKRLTPAQQLRLYSSLGVPCRLWWEWTEHGWREIV